MRLVSRIVRLYPPTAWGILGVIAAWIIAVVVLRGTSLLDLNIYRYMQPLFAVALAGVTWWFSKGRYSHLRRQREKALFLMSICLLWVIGYFLTGLIATYAQNPLMGSLASAFLNIVLYGVMGIAVEWARYRLVLMTGRRHPVAAGSGIALLLLLLQATALTLDFSDGMSAIQAAGSVLLPLVVYHLVQIYLAYTAGFASMGVFAVAWLVMYTLLPIMPKYDWYMVGMSAVGFGVIVIMLLDRTRQNARRQIGMGRHQQKKAMNVLFVGCMVALVLFMTGAFAYKPTVIMSNSMQPVYGRGDAVIVRQKSPEMNIGVGDIIQYSYKDRLITHRVVELVDSGNDNDNDNVVQYITRGDNSDSNDPWLVSEEQISGTIRARLPLVGWPTVYLYEMMQRE